MVMITLRNKKIGEKTLIGHIYFIKMVEKIQIYKEEVVLIKQKIYY